MPDPLLFDPVDLPETGDGSRGKNFQSLRFPVWTQNKAELIGEYIRLFTFVTKHGANIDGFAAPQERNRPELCAAKRVMDARPGRVRDMWLCDTNRRGLAQLESFKALDAVPNRRVNVVPGDFNKTVISILASGHIRENVASFALLDQRTFECEWATVQRLARHKVGRKIELFYFFATGWLDRAIVASKTSSGAAKIERWWGQPDLRALRDIPTVQQAKVIADRFKDELGYRFALPYPIHDSARGKRIMYHMVHATDHEAAPELMLRAYRKASGRSDLVRPTTQADFDEVWGGAMGGNGIAAGYHPTTAQHPG